MTQLKDVYDEWQNNPQFRAQFKKDPEKALQEAGFELNADDLQKIKAITERKDQGSPDEKLGDRINK